MKTTQPIDPKDIWFEGEKLFIKISEHETMMFPNQNITVDFIPSDGIILNIIVQKP